MSYPKIAATITAAALIFLLCVGTALAQSERGTISGSVTDPTGAAVPGAKVNIINRATNVPASTTTNESGAYAIPNLSPGDYSVRVEKEGFKAAAIADIVVNAASSIRADIALEVGAVQQTVEVSSSAIALQTDNARSATVVTNKLVDELPTVVGGAMRSPFDLAILTPESKNFGDNNFQMGGGQAAAFGVSLDGVSATTTRALSNSWVAVNTPSLEAITEFTVETNGFKAEYGHAGGGQMTFVSKSGTNQLHGSAYEFLRNTELDANDWFANANKNPAPRLQAERFRRRHRRPGVDSQDLQRQGQDVLFLLLRSLPQPRRSEFQLRHRPHRRNVQGRLQQVGERRRGDDPDLRSLQPEDKCRRSADPRSLPEQSDRHFPLRSALREGPRRLPAVWRRAQAECDCRSRNHRLRHQQLHHQQRHGDQPADQVQRQGRPQLRPERSYLRLHRLEPHRRATGHQRPAHAARLLQRLQRHYPQQQRLSHELGSQLRTHAAQPLLRRRQRLGRERTIPSRPP